MQENLRLKLGERIRQHRERLSMTQTDLAKAVHKSSPAYIAFIESGDRNISTLDLMLIAKVLGVTVSELVGEGEPKKKPEFTEALRASSGLTKNDQLIVEALVQSIKNIRNGNAGGGV